MAIGNGIRADTWSDFLQRFGDIRICECYGATEGNVGFINYIGKVGAIGKENFLQKVSADDLELLSAGVHSVDVKYGYFEACRVLEINGSLTICFKLCPMGLGCLVDMVLGFPLDGETLRPHTVRHREGGGGQGLPGILYRGPEG